MAKKPIERMETATYQEFGRSRSKQRKTLKIAEKISHVPQKPPNAKENLEY